MLVLELNQPTEAKGKKKQTAPRDLQDVMIAPKNLLHFPAAGWQEKRAFVMSSGVCGCFVVCVSSRGSCLCVAVHLLRRCFWGFFSPLRDRRGLMWSARLGGWLMAAELGDQRVPGTAAAASLQMRL